MVKLELENQMMMVKLTGILNLILYTRIELVLEAGMEPLTQMASMTVARNGVNLSVEYLPGDEEFDPIADEYAPE